MPPFIYRCPTTGLSVQGLVPDDEESEGADGADSTYESVKCIACGRMHFINPKTGKLMGEK
jgi:hypothetical protein